MRLQSNLIAKITDGWRPTTPLSRGGQVPLREPHFVLERFRKELPSFEGTFFQFHNQSQLQIIAGTLPAHDPGDLVSDEASSSSDSTSSEDSSDASSASRPPKISKKQLRPPVDTAEEAFMGLHRRTWHMMISTDASRPNLPTWDGHSLKTACGRFLTQTKNPSGIPCDTGSRSSALQSCGMPQRFHMRWTVNALCAMAHAFRVKTYPVQSCGPAWFPPHYREILWGYRIPKLQFIFSILCHIPYYVWTRFPY